MRGGEVEHWPPIRKRDPELEKHLMSDLNMLAVTGGKERTEAEYAGLLAQASLKLLRVIKVSGDSACIVEAAHAE